MVVYLNQMYEQIKKEFDIQLLAGKDGIKKEIRWIHMVETSEISSFLEGDEMVFTTGVGLKSEEELFQLVQCNYENGASGMIVNLGPYIPSVESSIIKYCDDVQFPLFVVPWEVKMARIMRIFSLYILKEEKKIIELESAMIHILISKQYDDVYTEVMNKYQYQSHDTYQVLTIAKVIREESEKLKAKISPLIYRNQQSFIFTYYKNRLVLLLQNPVNSEIRSLITSIENAVSSCLKRKECIIAVGDKVEGLRNIHESYRQAIFTERLVCTGTLKKTYYFNELGIGQLLLDIKPTTTTERFIERYVNKIINYDFLNDTNYYEVLQAYIQRNGKVNEVAEDLYLHRNTIHYRLRKIEDLLQCDLSDFSVRMEIEVSFLLNSLFQNRVSQLENKIR